MRLSAFCVTLIGTIALLGCARKIEVANHDSQGLVEAIRSANASPGASRISLAHRGLYVLPGAAEAGLLLPAIKGRLIIEGNGSEIRSYAPGRVALVEVRPGSEVTLRDLSLAEGSNGAIRNFGKLRLESARVLDSSGTSVSAIVLNHGELTARDSEVAYNNLEATQRDAGTFINYGDLRLENTGIHDNHVQRMHPGLVAAGAVLNMGNRGNGRVDGQSPVGLTREAGTGSLPLSGL